MSTDLDGATTPGSLNAYPANPGEFAARWNALSEEERADFLARRIDADEAAARCIRESHALRAAYAPTAYWNGLPTAARRGTAVVADTPNTPMHWARTEGIVGERIAVVEVDLNGVNYGGGITYLDDRQGEGWAKVSSGGSPRVGHRDVSIVPDSFEVAA